MTSKNYYISSCQNLKGITMAYSLKSKMEKYDYPAGYRADYPDPMADIELLRDEYYEHVKKLKLTALKTTIKNTLKTISKKEDELKNLEQQVEIFGEESVTRMKKTISWLKGKLEEYREEYCKYAIEDVIEDAKKELIKEETQAIATQELIASESPLNNADGFVF